MTSTEAHVRRARGLASLGLALQAAAALLLPKCPLCVAAWLSVWGVGAGAAWALATYARLAMVLLLAAALALWCWRLWRRRAHCRLGPGHAQVAGGSRAG